jgi:hypothetical protein
MEAIKVRIFPAIGIYPITIYASKYLIPTSNSKAVNNSKKSKDADAFELFCKANDLLKSQ